MCVWIRQLLVRARGKYNNVWFKMSAQRNINDEFLVRFNLKIRAYLRDTLCAFSKNSFTRSYFQENLEMKTIWIIFVGNKQHYSHTLCIFHIFSTAFNRIVVLILLAQGNLRGMKPCGCAEMSRTL